MRKQKLDPRCWGVVKSKGCCRAVIAGEVRQSSSRRRGPVSGYSFSCSQAARENEYPEPPYLYTFLSLRARKEEPYKLKLLAMHLRSAAYWRLLKMAWTSTPEKLFLVFIATVITLGSLLQKKSNHIITRQIRKHTT